jgi:hypothetical protein
MLDFDPDPNEIIRRRVLTETRLTQLLEEAGGDVTLNIIQFLIFDYHHTRSSTYFAQLFALFSSLPNGTGIDTLLPVIEDAWNYFPHRSLDGRCPAEILAELS